MHSELGLDGEDVRAPIGVVQISLPGDGRPVRKFELGQPARR